MRRLRIHGSPTERSRVTEFTSLTDLYATLLSNCQLHTNRLSGCRTLPKDITAVLWVLYNFKTGKINWSSFW